MTAQKAVRDNTPKPDAFVSAKNKIQKKMPLDEVKEVNEAEVAQKERLQEQKEAQEKEARAARTKVINMFKQID